MVGKMDPNGVQCSINCPFSDNAVVCPGLTLPRSFTLVHHENVRYGVFSTLSIILSPGKSFTRPRHERQAWGASSNLSHNHSRTPILDLFSLVGVRGNSRALVLSTTQGNQTRILFARDFVWAFFGGLIAAHQAETELDVAYTVIRPHSALECTFALSSDYLKDFNSSCFTEKGAPCTRFMDEFTSRAAHLNTVLNQEKNKEDWGC